MNKERDELLKILGVVQETNKVKAKAIVKSLEPIRKKYKRKGLHWTQKPENKAKMLKNIKRATKAKRG